MGAPDSKSGIIRETAIWRGLVAIVERIKPKLVNFDTLADISPAMRVRGGKRGSSSAFCAGLRSNSRRRLARASELVGDGQRKGTSGSTAWSNSVRSRLYLETIKGDDDREIDADLRVLRVKKSNYGPTGSEIRLRWSKGCFVRETPAGGFDKLVADTKAERVFLDLLGKLSAQGRDVSPKPSQSYAPAVFEKHPNAEGIRKRESRRRWNAVDGAAHFCRERRACVASVFEDLLRRQRPKNEPFRTVFRRIFELPSNAFERGVRSHPLYPGGVRTPPVRRRGPNAAQATRSSRIFLDARQEATTKAPAPNFFASRPARHGRGKFYMKCPLKAKITSR